MTNKFLKTIGCLATVLALAACSGEDLTDGNSKGIPLPDGVYPITFSATQLEVTPQTRVSDYDATDGTHKSQFNDGDRIKVTVSYATNQTSTFCTLNADGTVNSYDSQLYWQSTGEHTINAWYSNLAGQNTATNNTVNLDEQGEKGLAYVLKAEQKATYGSTQPLLLEFAHQLAKVRVNLVAGTTITDLTNATVKVKNQYTGCSISPTGEVSSTGEAIGTITMHKATYGDETYYEANIVPGTTLAANCFEISAGDKTTTATTTAITTKAGRMYSFTVMVNKEGTQTVDLADESIYTNDIYTVAANASVIIDGSGKVLEKRIVIKEGAHVVLKNVKLKGPVSNYSFHQYKPVIEVLGTATITFCGEDNVITSCVNTLNDAISVTGENATLTINGTLKDKLILDASASSDATGIGAAKKANLIINGGTIIATAGDDAAAIGSKSNTICGNITINGGNITANAGKDAAAIGGGSNAGQCGDITIIRGTVIANGSDKGLGSVGIGSGTATQTTMPTCGFISIFGGNITATGGSGKYGGAGIGAGANTAYCKDITITGGTVTAIGKLGTLLTKEEYGSGAGIGTSCYGQCDSIKISGVNTTVKATAGGNKSYDIGIGYDPDNPNWVPQDYAITIDSNAKVTATNGRIYGYPNGLN